MSMTYLQECFDCDAGRGILTWKKRPRRHFKTHAAWLAFNRKWAGKQAGSLMGGGYIKVLVDGKRLLAHRIIYLMVHGELPRMLDHINGDPSDNRISNLRPATPAQNQANAKRRSDNSTGYKGVYRTRRGKFISYIATNGKPKHIGVFSTPEEAHAAYCEAQKAMHGEFARSA